MRRAAALLAALLCIPLVLSSEADAKVSFEDHIGRVVPGLLRRYEVPSAAVAIVRDGKVAWTRRFDHEEAIRGGDIFKVASLSKTATALAVLWLAEEGRVDLDAPIDRYLKRWHVPPSPFDESDVTARRVMNHTAGFPTSGRGGGEHTAYPPAEEILKGTHGLLPATLVAEPGAGFMYSNVGYVALELLVEEVTKESFPDAMRDLVFRPLDMDDTGYQDNDALVASDVPGYWKTGRRAPQQTLVPRGPGGMLSTPQDISRLVLGASVAKKSGGLLDEDSLRQMHSVLRSARGAFGLSDKGGYGLGVATMKLPSGRTLVVNNGSFTGYNSMMLGLPSERAGIVVLTNSNTGLGIELELALEWSDTVVGERPGLISRFSGVRSGIRYVTIALLLLCVVLLVRALLQVRDGRRVRAETLPVRKLLLKTVPLVAIGVALFLLIGTSLRTAALGGIPPARFISGDYQWLITGLSLALVVLGAAATAAPKKPSSS